MKSDKHITYLRISYWVGALIDALVIIPMLSPSVCRAMFEIPDFNPSNDYGYASRIGASLMAGWVFLLLWADRKPMERKGVLMLTTVPVVAGLFLSGIYAVTTGLVTMDKMIPTWVMQVMLIVLFTGSYLNAKRQEKQ